MSHLHRLHRHTGISSVHPLADCRMALAISAPPHTLSCHMHGRHTHLALAKCFAHVVAYDMVMLLSWHMICCCHVDHLLPLPVQHTAQLSGMDGTLHLQFLFPLVLRCRRRSPDAPEMWCSRMSSTLSPVSPDSTSPDGKWPWNT